MNIDMCYVIMVLPCLILVRNICNGYWEIGCGFGVVLAVDFGFECRYVCVRPWMVVDV